jgi:hypothetical protein
MIGPISTQRSPSGNRRVFEARAELTIRQKMVFEVRHCADHLWVQWGGAFSPGAEMCSDLLLTQSQRSVVISFEEIWRPPDPEAMNGYLE